MDGFGLRVPCTHRGRSLVSSVSDSGAGATCLPGGDRGSLHPIPPPPRPPAFTLMLGDRVLARGGTVCRRWRKQVTTSNNNSPIAGSRKAGRRGKGRRGGGGGRRRRSGGSEQHYLEPLKNCDESVSTGETMAGELI